MSRRSAFRTCPEFRRAARLDRRGFLRAGALGTAGLCLADLLRHEAQAEHARPENSVIILWMETTLVVAWGEFGRTPRVNANAGRDHYPNVFSAALAGGPVKGGRVVGASDAKAAFPLENPKPPQDVLATIYRHLGVDPSRHYLNAAGRPIAALPFGRPISELS